MKCLLCNNESKFEFCPSCIDDYILAMQAKSSFLNLVCQKIELTKEEKNSRNKAKRKRKNLSKKKVKRKKQHWMIKDDVSILNKVK